ncbi:MAG: hypothetical protein IPK82_00320 [Polyangiaceae bacterium]|nr:hypothetical protein [Polyangiaceae bacterium]
MRRGAALLTGLVWAGACTQTLPSQPGSNPHAQVKLQDAAAKLPYESPARWEVFPDRNSTFTSFMRLGDGRCLAVQHEGQRLLFSKVISVQPSVPDPDIANMSDQDLVDQYGEGPYPGDEIDGAGTYQCAGTALSAHDYAPEPIVRIVRAPSSFRYIGESGTVHESTTPLGNFVRRIYPPEPVLTVKGAGTMLFAVTRTGKLLRWEEEGGYVPVNVDGAMIVDVALLSSNAVLAVAAPEAIYTSVDGGKKFTKRNVKPIGAVSADRVRRLQIGVRGALKNWVWNGTENGDLTESNQTFSDQNPVVAFDTQPRAVAQHFHYQKAAIDGNTIWYFAHPRDSTELYKYAMDGTSFRRLDSLRDETSQVGALAARGEHVAVLMLEWTHLGSSPHLRVSHNGGATFESRVDLTSSDLGRAKIAILADGTVFTAGLCREEGEGDRSEECSGRPMLYKSDRTWVEVEPELRGKIVGQLALSADGRSAYMLWMPDGESTLSLLVSHDGGAHFTEHVLRAEVHEETWYFQGDDTAQLSVSETGTVGMSVERSGERIRVWLTTDKDGENARVGDVPADDMVVAGFGDRVLAVRGRATQAATEGSIWESSDGGHTWQEAPAPVAVAREFHRYDDVACSAMGCLVGSEVVRVGWGSDKSAPLLFNPPQTPEPAATLRTAITCEPAKKGSWTSIANVADLNVMPTEGSAARRNVAWLVPTMNPKTGAAGVVTAVLAENGTGEGRIVTKQLFPPEKTGTSWGFISTTQIEGVAMARAPIGRVATGVSNTGETPATRLRNLEVAWENIEEGTTSRGTIADAGVVNATENGATYPRHEMFGLDVLSVTPGGIFVRPDPSANETFFIDSHGKVKSLKFSGWPAPMRDWSILNTSEPVNVGGTFIMTGLARRVQDRETNTLVLAAPPPAGSKPNAPWNVWASTLGPASSSDDRRHVSVDYMYEGGQLGLYLVATVPSADFARAWTTRIQADGTLSAAAPAPTVFELGTKPRPCTHDERAKWPRLRTQTAYRGQTLFPGTRHPVLVDDGLGPMPAPSSNLDSEGLGFRPTLPPSKTRRVGKIDMLTTGVIFRGPAGSPCVDAFAAENVENPGEVVLILGDLQRAWLFRETDGELPGLDVHPLECRYAPTAIVPDKILSANR